MLRDRFKESEDIQQRNAFPVVSPYLKENSHPPPSTKQKTTAFQAPETAETTSTGKRKEEQAAEEGENKKAPTVQTGIDQCITVKRKSSPLENTDNIKRANTKEETMRKGSTEDIIAQVRAAKPPPIYLREHSSNEFIKNIAHIIETSDFHVVVTFISNNKKKTVILTS